MTAGAGMLAAFIKSAARWLRVTIVHTFMVRRMLDSQKVNSSDAHHRKSFQFNLNY